MQVSPIIRKAVQKDLTTLLTFARNTFVSTYQHLNDPSNFETYLSSAFSESQFQQEMLEPNSNFYLLEQDGKLFGYIKLNFDKADGGLLATDCVELERIYVREGAKGKGYGKMLIHAAAVEGRKQGKSILWLGVWEKNERAIHFYEKCGFKKYGTHIFSIGNDHQTDFLMKKDI